LVTFRWRARPPSLLTEDMIKVRFFFHSQFHETCLCFFFQQEVRRNRNVWTAKLDIRDRMLRTGESAKQQEHRRKLLEEFQKLKEKNLKRLAIQKGHRMKLRAGIDTDTLFDVQSTNIGEEVVEFLLKTEEVEYKP